jgi:hypothetical protein
MDEISASVLRRMGMTRCGKKGRQGGRMSRTDRSEHAEERHTHRTFLWRLSLRGERLSGRSRGECEEVQVLLLVRVVLKARQELQRRGGVARREGIEVEG